jgi:hypothetical protein
MRATKLQGVVIRGGRNRWGAGPNLAMAGARQRILRCDPFVNAYADSLRYPQFLGPFPATPAAAPRCRRSGEPHPWSALWPASPRLRCLASRCRQVRGRWRRGPHRPPRILSAPQKAASGHDDGLPRALTIRRISSVASTPVISLPISSRGIAITASAESFRPSPKGTPGARRRATIVMRAWNIDDASMTTAPTGGRLASPNVCKK